MAKKIIRCPKCGHEGSFFTGITGTAWIKLGDDGCIIAGMHDYKIDDSDHFDCPNSECDFETYDMDDFFTTGTPWPQWMMNRPQN
jgi:hypothetical protein